MAHSTRRELTASKSILSRRACIVGYLYPSALAHGIVVEIDIRAFVEAMVQRVLSRWADVVMNVCKAVPILVPCHSRRRKKPTVSITALHPAVEASWSLVDGWRSAPYLPGCSNCGEARRLEVKQFLYTNISLIKGEYIHRLQEIGANHNVDQQLRLQLFPSSWKRPQQLIGARPSSSPHAQAGATVRTSEPI